MEEKKYKIAVCLVTYNHSEYISQAIESVLSQETEFPFILLIGEDCSSDNTLSICLEYEAKNKGIIKVFKNKINCGLVKNTLKIYEYILENGIEYTAMLDGDDYWSDPHKLQKQIMFLESHKDYGVVHTSIQLLINNKILDQKKNFFKTDKENSLSHLPLANCTVIFRSELIKLLNKEEIQRSAFLSLDYIFSIVLAKNTKIKYIEDITAVWRRGHDSVSNPNDLYKEMKYIEHHVNVWRYINQLYPLEFPFDEEWGREYAVNESLKLAFRYNNFALANKLSKDKKMKYFNLFSLNNIRIFLSQNKILFSIYFFIYKNKSFFRVS